MSTNISKEKRNILISKIYEIKRYIQLSPHDKNTTNLLNYISEIEKDIKSRKYGLIFEEHKEAIDETLENNIPVLIEKKECSIINDGILNFIIEGDNLSSLNVLNRTHNGRVDVIYIDPPYNTGNKDFIYDDSYVDSVDTFRHSKWLSFMKKRLELSVKLLKKDGIIFISIDENEAANLKLLCDQIFGEDNYVVEFNRKVSASPRMDAKHIAVANDKILVYAKNKNFLVVTKKESETYQNKPNVQKDEHFDERGYFILNKLDRGSINYSKTCDYPIITPTGNVIYPGGDYKKWEQRQNGHFNMKDWCWRWNKAKFEWGLKNDYIVFKKNSVYFKQYEKVDNSLNPIVRENVYSNLLDDSSFFNDTAKKEISALFSKTPFDYPKPISLIKFLINLHPNKRAVVLDFFAGSGTTGHAVMKLNAEDNGKRKFILCTNNENNICREVTYERIKKVIKIDNYKVSLKYMKVNFIPITDKFYYEYADELLMYVKELVEIENFINFDGNKEIAIILTEKELDKFTNNIPIECKKVYLGHNILPTEEQEMLFKRNKIKINIIPDYYYRDLED